MAHIHAKDLSVEFSLHTISSVNLKKKLLSLTTGGRIAADAHHTPVFTALTRLNFVIKPGDRVGLMGHNGSGKTTLLRVIAGVYHPQKGQLDVVGRINSLLDIHLGIESEATGYENIIIRGIMMGLSLADIAQRTEEIAAFSELGDFLHLPIRTYSSGMMVRLAFAVSTSIPADIVLMDEWLSVGDQDFQEKSSRRLTALIDGAQIFILASHSEEFIKKTCNRILYLERGAIVKDVLL